MTTYTPRVRMIAGPNGSGKSTLKSALNSSYPEFFIGLKWAGTRFQKKRFSADMIVL